MTIRKYWSLSAKLALIGIPFLLLVLLFTATTLWVSWMLDGGAAAVNEAGRMRMQSYRMSLAVGTGDVKDLPKRMEEFNQSLELLRRGDPERPLFVPWDTNLRQKYADVENDWSLFKDRWLVSSPRKLDELDAQTLEFSSKIEEKVTKIEVNLVRWTAILHLLQIGVLALAVIGAGILLISGYLFVIEPVYQLKRAIHKIQAGDFGARVARVTTDEFGTLAVGFNDMAAHLQSMYKNLESKVQEKTAELKEKSERLESLYEVTALVTQATSLDELAQDFSQRVMHIARADGVAIRWSDQTNQRYLMLAASGLPVSMVENEQCLRAGDCHCGNSGSSSGLRVIPIQSHHELPLPHCAKAGFATVVNIPIRLQERLMGEVSLFFNAEVSPSVSERSLLETLTSHLASAMENLRLHALEREAAISGERHWLARELHDSIAQSLAFLKIQVQLMRDALKSGESLEIQKVLEEIDVGVRESYGDVRELLMHFRTRTNAEDIEPALATTLQKFEHQTGLKTNLNITGHGIPMSPDMQIQVLHIVQEALSNVRKHSHASQVWLDVEQQPVWKFEVRDDGIGFSQDRQSLNETHVGMRIMSERALRIGATLDIFSTLHKGSSIILTLPTPASSKPSSQINIITVATS